MKKKEKNYSKINQIPSGHSKENIVEGCLCLEGGAFRGCYTAGVLDCMMENDINLETTVGVSAGSLCGLLYVSGDIGKAARINLLYRHDKRYVGWKAFANNRGLIGFDFAFNGVSQAFDAERFYSTKRRFLAVATSLDTGKATYFEKGKTIDILKACQASASMPFISAPVIVEGNRYLDGGVACRIPYSWAMNEGFNKIVVVLTRERGFRNNSKGKLMESAKLLYHNYHTFAERLSHSIDEGNRVYEQIDKLVDEGKIFAIYPSKPIDISRLEGDVDKLAELYYMGYQDCQNQLADLKEYLNIHG